MKTYKLKENMRRFGTKNLKKLTEQSKEKNLDIKWSNLKDGEYIIQNAEKAFYGMFRISLEDRYGNNYNEITWGDYPGIMSNKAGIYYYSDGRKFWTHDENPNWNQKFKVRNDNDDTNIVRIKINSKRSPYSLMTFDAYAISLEQAETIKDAPNYTYKISGLPLPKNIS